MKLYTNTHMFRAGFFLNESLHFILTCIIAANIMNEVNIVTPTRDTIIIVALVIVFVIGVLVIIVVIVEEPHSSSLKEAINTGQEDLMHQICALIFIAGFVDTHCCNICTRSSAATSDVP